MAVNSDTTKFLDAYGYTGNKTPSAWEISPKCSPTLALVLDGHAEENGHTMYYVACSLKSEAFDLSWQSPHRLIDLRKRLHIIVSNGCSEYGKLFAGAPFAPRGGLPGTTSRLAKWLVRLAEVVNKGSMAPEVVQSILLFFDTPPLDDEKGAMSPEEMGQYYERIDNLFMKEVEKHFLYEAAERCLDLQQRGHSRLELLHQVLRCFVEVLEDYCSRVTARDSIWDPVQLHLIPLDDARIKFEYEKLQDFLEPALQRALCDAASAASMRRDSDARNFLLDQTSALRDDCDALLGLKTEATEALQDRLEELDTPRSSVSDAGDRNVPALSCSRVSKRFLFKGYRVKS